jgi:hypothetical protein
VQPQVLLDEAQIVDGGKEILALTPEEILISEETFIPEEILIPEEIVALIRSGWRVRDLDGLPVIRAILRAAHFAQ